MRLFSILFIVLFSATSVLALTDPEPNPFSDLAEGERVFMAEILEVSEDILTVQNSDDEEFSGRMEAIFKYRDGAGPAAVVEFFVGDQVRVLVNAEGVVVAVQNFELLLCDQNFYGWVRNPADDQFTLKNIDGESFEVFIGQSTQYRDENPKLLFGYSPREGDIVRIHGVINKNANKIFTETFGAYISLLSEDALQPFIEEIEARKIDERKKLEEELKKQKFSDVPPEHPFFFAVNFIANKKIVDGYDDGDFRPDNEINRAEFTKILINTRFAEELANFELTESCFPDFEMDVWFAKFVCFAKENKIIGGYPDGKFRPDKPVNLAEAITILVKSFGFSVEVNDGDEWFVPFLDKAKKLEILPEDFAKADKYLTRGEMSELVMRGVLVLDL
jgi:hypothetical protein